MALPLLLGALGLGAAGGAALNSYLGGSGGPAKAPEEGQGNFLTGYAGQTRQFERFNPQQQNVQNQALQQVLSLLQGNKRPGGFNFAPIAQQAKTQFQTETIPGLAERFTAMGGGQRSSAFQSALGRAGAGLNENLAALEAKYGLAQEGQNDQFLQLLLSLGMQPSFESAYTPRQPGLIQETIAPLSRLALGSYLGLL